MRWMLAVAAAGLCGCGLYPDGACGRQRSLTVDENVPNLIVHLQIVDEADRADVLSWAITLQGLNVITAAHLHDGTPGGSGRMLYDFTSTNPDPGSTVAGSAEYSHDTGVDNIFELVRSGRTYVDVHTSSNPTPTAQADLTDVEFEDWSEYYCS
jgi:hypothetical protein